MKEGWTCKKLGEVCDIIGGGTPDKKNADFYKGNIPWATVRDMNCDILSTTDFCISEEGLHNSASHVIKKDNIIIATRVGLGKVCKLAQDTAINQDLKGIVPKQGNINNNFLFYYFKDKAKFIEANGIGATVKGVKLIFIEELLLSIPPLAEQQRIVSRLDAAFAHIDELKTNAEKQLGEARALFQKALDKALCNGHWKKTTLNEICIQITDGTHRTPKYTTSGIPFLSVKNVTSGIIDMINTKFISKEEHNEFIKRCNPEYGDILYTKVGTTGVAKVIDVKQEFSIFVSLALLKINESSVFNRFLEYVLNSPYVYKQSQKLTSGAANRNFLLNDIKKVELFIPPLSEQQRIVSRLDSLSAHVRELEEVTQKTISECDALKQAILRQVFE